MSDGTRTRARQAELTVEQKRALDRDQRALAKALEAVDKARETLGETAGSIAVELGRGGASAVARHMEWTPQYVSTLASAHKAKQAAEGSAAA